MKRKIKVVEINGLRGILFVIYVVICAIAGFILFPAWGLMQLWNLLGTYIYNLPQMSLLHGFMLYAILVLLYFATNSHRTCVGISSIKLNKSHIASIMNDLEDKK